MTGAGAATSKVDASVIRVLGGDDTHRNGITSLDVRADLVVGSMDAPAYLTVTTSNLRNLTQQRGATTFDGAVAVDGMTSISGKDSVNNGTVTVSAGSTFGAGITVNTGGVLTGIAGTITLGRNAEAAAVRAAGSLRRPAGGHSISAGRRAEGGSALSARRRTPGSRASFVGPRMRLRGNRHKLFDNRIEFAAGRPGA